ncbi:MAG TPA: hypothetical protein VF173_00825 [Thermoanaerobaculia bacterium]|nr:hypothetical protein [Thermoanaerobaculia bacterium]
MARRGRGFSPQAPKKVTLIIAAILWLIGTLVGLGVVHLPANLGNAGFWALVVAGFLLILGCLVDGV